MTVSPTVGVPLTPTPDSYRRALALAQDLSMAIYAIAQTEGALSPFNTSPTTLYGVPYALDCVIDHCAAHLDSAPTAATTTPQEGYTRP